MKKEGDSQAASGKLVFRYMCRNNPNWDEIGETREKKNILKSRKNWGGGTGLLSYWKVRKGPVMKKRLKRS